MEDVLGIVFGIALLGHGVAHLVASFDLARQGAGVPREGVIPVRTPVLRNASDRVSAAVGLVFWVSATIAFVVAVPAMLDLFIGDLPWSALLVVGSVISTAGIALFTGIWPGGEARLRALHVFLALGMNLVILVTQLLLGWPAG